ncbi:MAG: UTP--glucose-1-phosphate uridylyltransferase GalU [Pseudomonadota bacterium]
MQKQVRVAVFPVAGRGTRFLPATKASPKEMLPVVDKPLIQYAVEEAIAAGATRLVFVTGASKRAIEDHFDKDPELERALAENNKHELLESVRDIVPEGVSCIYIRQGEPLGLGHAVLCAKPAVGNQPFFVHLADDLIHGDEPCLREMAAYREARGGELSVLGVETVPPSQTGSYGIVDLQDGDAEKGGRIRFMVEKPSPDEAPSNLAVVGRYLLEPTIFEKLQRTGKGAGGEIQLTDGIAAMLEDAPVHAMPFTGTRYDCGSKIGYLQATVELALAHPDLGDRFAAYLSSR